VFVPRYGDDRFWATLAQHADFTRFDAASEQAIGQVVAPPTTMSLFAAMG
jgi:cytosine/uracil/thiamine/allantoin permease